MAHFRILAVLAVGLGPRPVGADQSTHRYQRGEQVNVWTDKVGPYNNPQETYSYETLGLCELEGDDIKVEQGDVGIGESLQGHDLYSSPRLKIEFNLPLRQTPVCTMTLTEEKANALAAMINENYWYELFIDDLPIWAFVGQHSKFAVDTSRLSQLGSKMSKPNSSALVQKDHILPAELQGKPIPRLYAHRHFTFFSNGDQIIEVDMEPSNLWPIYPGVEINLTYSVAWFETPKEFSDRNQRYLDPKFFEHKVHWFSIVNSFMLCLFLCAVVAIILMKTLKRDFIRYSVTDAEELESMAEGGDESGWKQVSGDVFRRPDHLAWFSVLHASGCHIFCTVFFTLMFSVMNSYYAQRGATAGSMVVSYLCTVIAGGYEGGRVFRWFGGQHWKRTMVYQVLFIPTLIFVSFFFINTTALIYGSTMALPFRTVAIIILLFIVLCIPLHTVGALLGRRAASEKTLPCRVHHLKRPIPSKHWAFMPTMMVTAGLVPFGCLFIEMYFILSAVWSHNKVYYVYGFLFAIMILLCLVLVCVSITCVYVLLNSEDYRWQWHSFQCCSSTAVYVFLYTIYYYYNSTHMSGFLQWIYYFGTSLNFCIGLGLMCGSFGFLGASQFVQLIYSNIKAE